MKETTAHSFLVPFNDNSGDGGLNSILRSLFLVESPVGD